MGDERPGQSHPRRRDPSQTLVVKSSCLIANSTSEGLVSAFVTLSVSRQRTHEGGLAHAWFARLVCEATRLSVRNEPFGELDEARLIFGDIVQAEVSESEPFEPLDSVTPGCWIISK